MMTDACLSSLQLLIQRVKIEHESQITKWGVQTHTSFEWLTFLAEEVGELAEAISEYEYRSATTTPIFNEAIQVATLALKIAEMSKLMPSFKKEN